MKYRQPGGGSKPIDRVNIYNMITPDRILLLAVARVNSEAGVRRPGLRGWSDVGVGKDSWARESEWMWEGKK